VVGVADVYLLHIVPQNPFASNANVELPIGMLQHKHVILTCSVQCMGQ
jgi:hypothetical protein